MTNRRWKTCWRPTFPLVLGLGLIAGSAIAAGPATNDDPWAQGKLYARNRVFVIPEHKVQLGPEVYKRTWDFTSADRGNFTFFDALTNLAVAASNTLQFTLTSKMATIGWGNYAGLQTETNRILLWPAFNVTLAARQTMPTATVVSLRFWESGKRDTKEPSTYDEKRHSAVITGTQWQVMEFPIRLPLPRRDGFDMEITGPAGNTLEFRPLQIWRTEQQGYFRKEIYIPTGHIWRALVEVGNQAHLYINGREIPCRDIITMRPNFWGADMYRSEFLDISADLQVGATNCIGLYGWRAGYAPYITLQGSVILSSGERILLDTDAAWRWTRAAPEDWNRPGFDDSGWSKVSDQRGDKTNAVVVPQWCSNYKGRTACPIQDGYLRLENPRDNRFFYSDQEPLTFRAFVPNGLEARQPVVEWIVHRYDQGQLTELQRGTESNFTYEGRSLRFAWSVGCQPHGIYVLETRLKAGAEILDQPAPDPLVVVGKIPMRPTDGDSYTQDMDLELEREIDLTRAEDGPWLESDGANRPSAPTTNTEGGVTAPAIVKRQGLTYRESRPAYGSVISYLVQFRHPGDFYLMELDYPNDAERFMGVACCPRNWGLSSQLTYSKTSAAVATGERYPLTRRMQTLRWIYRPDPGNHALNLVNMSGIKMPAAAARLRYYHIRNDLPALRTPEIHTRWNGHLTERTVERRFAIEREVLPDNVNEYYKSLATDPKVNPILELCKILEHALDAAEHYAQYMRFVGQNVHMMGCYQYNNGNTPFLPAPAFPYPRVTACDKDMLARVLRENNIDFFASVEFVYNSVLMEMAGRQGPRPESGFWDTLYLVNEKGQEYIEWEGHYGMNFNHPVVRREMLKVADELGRKFQRLPNFRGVNWTPYFGEDWIPVYRGRGQTDCLALGYDDVTIRKFEQDTGLTTPFAADDPLRFAKRYAYLTSAAMRPKWLAWRAATLKEFFAEAAATVQRWRADLNCVCNLYMNPIHDLEWRQSGLPFADFMRLNGWDGRLFREDSTVWLAHTMYGKLNSHGNMRKYGVGWEMSSDPERFAFFSAEQNRAVQVKHDWQEVEEFAWALPYRPDWPRFFQMTLMEQPDDDNTLEVFTRGLIGADAVLFYYGFADATLFEGNEQPLREFNRVLQSLPREKFQPVAGTGLQSNFAVRELHKGETYYFYVANPAYWPVAGSVTLEQAPEVINLPTGQVVVRGGRSGTAKVKIQLKPFGVAAFRVPNAKAKITAWDALPERGLATEHLEAILQRTADLLQQPAAVAVLRPEDEAYLRQTVQTAQADLKQNRWAAALFTASKDRFWLLKQEYLEKGARFGTEPARSAGLTTDKRRATAARADIAPVIDGRLDDPIWRKAEVYSGFIAADQMPAMADTKFQVAYDQDHLYLALQCRDRDPKSIKHKAVREKEGGIFADDCVAVFLQPDTAAPKYYQMAVNAGGVRFDQKVVGGARDYTFAPPWEAQAAITDEGWTAEICWPLTSLEGQVTPQHPWGFNLHRMFRDQLIPVSSWSYSPKDAHDTERFGQLVFPAP